MQALLRNRVFLWLVGSLFLFNILINNHNTSLWDEDEAAYAGFAKTMVISDNWLIPDFMWAGIHKKPPLHFWSVATSYKLFGINEFASRVPSVMSVLGTIIILFFLGKRIFGRDTALGACLIMSSTLFIPNIAKIALTDASLLFFQTLSVLSLYLYIKEFRFKWNLLFWFGVAMGVLLKGPPILILSGGVWFFLALFHPNRKRLIGTHPWFFLPLALSPLLLWGYMAYQKNPEMVNWMIDWYITKRVSGSGAVLGQTAPPGYYALVLILCFLPVLPFFPAALWDGFKRLKNKEAESIFLAGWLIFGWFFYELMPSKLPTYVLGSVPALCILIARQMPKGNMDEYSYFRVTAVFSVLYVLIICALIIGLIFAGYQLLGSAASLQAIMFSIIIWPLSFISATLVFAKRYKYGIAGLIFNGLLFTTLAWLLLMPLVETPRSASKRMAKQLHQLSPEGTTVLLGDDFPRVPSIPFYLSQHFGKHYFHYYDLNRVIEILNEPYPYAAVVGEEWKNQIEESMHLKGDTLSFLQEVEGWTTDEVNHSSYWILMKYSE